MIDMHALDATVEQLMLETDEILPQILDARLETMPGFWNSPRRIERAGVPESDRVEQWASSFRTA